MVERLKSVVAVGGSWGDVPEEFAKAERRSNSEPVGTFGSRNLDGCGVFTVVFLMPDHRYDEFTSDITKVGCSLNSGRKKAAKSSKRNAPNVPITVIHNSRFNLSLRSGRQIINQRLDPSGVRCAYSEWYRSFLWIINYQVAL